MSPLKYIFDVNPSICPTSGPLLKTAAKKSTNCRTLLDTDLSRLTLDADTENRLMAEQQACNETLTQVRQVLGLS